MKGNHQEFIYRWKKTLLFGYCKNLMYQCVGNILYFKNLNIIYNLKDLHNLDTILFNVGFL